MQTELKEWKTRMNNMEDRIMEINQLGQQTENQMKKRESNIRIIWENIKQKSLHIIGIPEEEKKKNEGSKVYLKELWLKTFQI